jgi:hypothetical protein
VVTVYPSFMFRFDTIGPLHNPWRERHLLMLMCGSWCHWIHLAQDRGRWQALVETVMNLRVPKRVGDFLTSWVTFTISGRSQLMGVHNNWLDLSVHVLLCRPVLSIDFFYRSINEPTPGSRVLLEKLIVTQLVKKFPAFYRTLSFVAMFTRAHHWSLSWARWIQFNSMELSPSWEANSHSASQEIASFYRTRRFITVYTRARYWSLSWARWIQLSNTAEQSPWEANSHSASQEVPRLS